jgi:hypothetical protein
MPVATATTGILDTVSLRALLGPQVTAALAMLIFPQGRTAVVFVLLCLAKQLAKNQLAVKLRGSHAENTRRGSE